MKITRLQAAILTVIALSATALFWSGCGKKSAPGQPRVAKSSAEPNSFKEVTSKLDAGGGLYAYLSTEKWLDGLSGKVGEWRQLAASFPIPDPEDQIKVSRAFDVITSLIKNSGVENISGVGMSSIAEDEGLYRNTFVLHHYPGKDSGYLWSAFGANEHALDGLDLCPATTAVASFADLDLRLIWTAIEKEGALTGIPEVSEGLRKVPAMFAAATGLSLEQVLNSLGNEYGVIVTLDESKMVNIPGPAAPLSVPTPGILIAIKVKNDVIFDRLDAVIQSSPEMSSQIIRSDNGGVKMRTMPVPLPLPFPVRPTIARAGDYIFIATTDALITEVLEVKGGKKGLKSTSEFKKLSAGIPERGNQFSYISEKFAKTYTQVQSDIMKGTPGGAQRMQLITKLMGSDGAAFSYTVSANGDEGWVNVSNGSQDGRQMALLPVVAVAGVVAGFALPALAKARDKARGSAANNSCIMNLRQIDGAKAQWALETRKSAEDVPTWSDLTPYMGRGGPGARPTCPQGGTYTLNRMLASPTCSYPGHTLQ